MPLSQEKAQSNFLAPTTVMASYLRKTISISYLMGLLWAGRIIVITTAILGLLYGVYTVHKNGAAYTATMRISPAETDSSLGDIGGTGGLLAGLAGTQGAMVVPKFTQFLQAIGSQGVAQELDKRYGLLCRTFSSDCNQLTHQWRERTGMRAWFDGMLARLGNLPDPNGPRTIADLAAYVGGAVLQEQNKASSVVLLTYTSHKPELAVQFLSQVVKTTNDYVRAQSRETQKRYVEYLSEKAAKATNVELRQAIDTLLLQEERQLMMTEVDVPYAAKIMDGPTVAPVNRILKTLAVDTFVGLLIGMVIATLRDLLPRKWRFW